jgi:hypothetical protein
MRCVAVEIYISAVSVRVTGSAHAASSFFLCMQSDDRMQRFRVAEHLFSYKGLVTVTS